MKWTSWLASGMLVGLVAFVLYTSFTAGRVRCELCVAFEGREACRTVEADTEHDALAGARTTACALLASGVTATMACERAPATRSQCTRP